MASTGGNKSRGQERSDELLLAGQAEAVTSRVWPTPTASDGERSSEAMAGENPTLLGAARQWPTPTAEDSEQSQRRRPSDRTLTTETREWATPRTSDTNGAGQHGEGGIDLRTQVDQLGWPTPGANDHKGSAQVGQRRGQLDEAAEQIYSSLTAPMEDGHPAPETPPPGSASSPTAPSSLRRLNPLFVEGLMGWPEGWTSLAPIGCASSATV